MEIKKIYDPILEEHLKNKQKKAATAKKQLQTAGSVSYTHLPFSIALAKLLRLRKMPRKKLPGRPNK